MGAGGSAGAAAPGFTELVFSDLARVSARGKPSWIGVVRQCLVNPGMVASVLLRAQQCLSRAERIVPAMLIRSLASVLVGADFGPGMTIGRGLWLAHPQGVTIGFGLVIGDNVTLAGGVTCAVRDRGQGGTTYPVIGDDVFVGAHAVLVGGVVIGKNAMIGANSVVLTDVAENTVVMGNPARKVGVRDYSYRY